MRNVPGTILPNVLAQETNQAYIVLLDITHDNGTIYLCNNSVNLELGGTGELASWKLTQVVDLWATTQGATWQLEDIAAGGGGGTISYVAFPFTITLPTELEGQTSTAQLNVDNVSRELIDEIRRQENRLRIKITVVQASDMSIAAIFDDFTAQDVRYSAVSLSMSLTMENLMQERFPEGIFNAREWPGCF